MALWICLDCTTAFAVGLPYCPHCTGTNIDRDEDGMAKITVHGGPSNTDELAPGAPAPATSLNPAEDAGQTEAPAPDTAYDALTVVELRQLLRDRNTDREEDDQLSLSGNKAELIARLAADDEAAAGADNPADDG